MTPFGQELRRLRVERGISQKELAVGLNVSAAYLSALEHGRRGLPSFEFLQRVAGHFNIIWDDADALFRLARLSDPKTVIDTAGLAPEATALVNRLAEEIQHLDGQTIEGLRMIIETSAQNRLKRR